MTGCGGNRWSEHRSNVTHPRKASCEIRSKLVDRASEDITRTTLASKKADLGSVLGI